MTTTAGARILCFGLATTVAAACGAEPPPSVDFEHEVLRDPGIGEVRASTQVIHVRTQADYYEALERFGFRLQEAQLRRMIRAQMRAAFGPYDVAIAIDELELAGISPTQVMTIDLRGADPNGLGLVEHENAAIAKDVGNKVRNEHIGGYDQTSADNGYPAEGGFFLSSAFDLYTSERELDRDPSARWFADVFAPYAPELGGEAPQRPVDERATKVLSVLSAYVASSLTHLSGHALGLAVGEGYHNEGDNGCLMDGTDVRTFDERSKLDGHVERWCADEAAYLNAILPSP